MYDDAYTRNQDGELAVRTVNVTEGSNSSSYDDVFTRDTNGKLALRVTGGGSGDSHNKGYFADLEALQEAYPTGEAGDWAILGSTDTVWIWDSDNSEWVDSDKKGQVTSVNNQTGAVTISANDVLPSQTGYSGRVLGTDGFVAGWIKPEIVQRSTIPQASEDELGNIYQFIGTTDANYTNGYFYKCVSDGQQPATYSWSQVSVQPAPSGLPDQTGQSGKFLTTDGTDASWSDKPLVNTATGSRSLGVLGTVDGTYADSISIGSGAISYQANCVAIGSGATAMGSSCTAIGKGAISNQSSVAIGQGADSRGNRSIQIGQGQNTDSSTFKVANANGNYEIMSADGTIPADRLIKSINKYSTMPTAASTNEGWIVQYTGTTDSTYTHGYIYECKAQGTTPDETYAWEAVEVQASSGGSYLPLTGGTLTGALEVKDSNASSIKITNSGQIQFLYNGVAKCGITRMAGGANDNEILFDSYTGTECTLGRGNNKLKDIYTKNIKTPKINNGADINVPTTGGTMLVATPPAADGTYVLKATVSSGVVTLSWVAE